MTHISRSRGVRRGAVAAVVAASGALALGAAGPAQASPCSLPPDCVLTEMPAFRVAPECRCPELVVIDDLLRFRDTRLERVALNPQPLPPQESFRLLR